jgi:hypothetical protein
VSKSFRLENQTLEVIRLQSEVEEYEYQAMCEGYNSGVSHTKTASLDSGTKASDNDDDDEDDEEYEEAEDLGGENHW